SFYWLNSLELLIRLQAKTCLMRNTPISTESVDYGPVFVQEPDDVIFPTDSEEKKVSLNCQARGNPTPTYRYLV
uniref:Uncharacterized protein n=1 Tax=Accipiter nisus TaxID=211598 RepID=A0A8B9MZ11_9AVES